MLSMKNSKLTPTWTDQLKYDLHGSEFTKRQKQNKLYQALLEQKRRMGLSSLYYFAKYILKFSDMELQPHDELCTFIQRHLGKEMLILLPRGTFKSSVTSVALPLWMLCHNRDLRILITSARLPNAKGWLGLIQRHIETNEEFKLLFGNMRGEGIWHSTAMNVSGRKRFAAESSIIAGSAGSSQVSQHYDVALCDDLHDDTNITSKEIIDGVEEYFGGLLPILDPQPGGLLKDKMLRGKGTTAPRRGPRIVIGTRWHFDDIYGRIVAKERQRRKDGKTPNFKTLIRKAVNPSKTKYFFPTRFTQAALDDVMEQPGMSRYFFSCQYLNDPLPEEDQIFKLSKFGFFHSKEKVTPVFDENDKWKLGQVEPMPEFLTHAITCDPSMGETENSDYACIDTNAFDNDRNLYCWEIVRDRFIGPSNLLSRLYQAYEEHKPLKVGIETVAFQKSLRYGFEKMVREQGTYFHIVNLEASTKLSKELRIEGFEPFVTGGKFYLRVNEGTDLTQRPQDLYYSLVKGQDILADEFLRFPLAATDDCADAQAYMPQLVIPGGTRKTALPGHGTLGALKRRIKAQRRLSRQAGKLR